MTVLSQHARLLLFPFRWDSEHGHCHPWEWGWCPRKGSSSQAPAAKWDAKCSTSAHTSYFLLKTIGTAETSRLSDWTITEPLVFPQEMWLLDCLKAYVLLTTMSPNVITLGHPNIVNVKLSMAFFRLWGILFLLNSLEKGLWHTLSQEKRYKEDFWA